VRVLGEHMPPRQRLTTSRPVPSRGVSTPALVPGSRRSPRDQSWNPAAPASASRRVARSGIPRSRATAQPQAEGAGRAVAPNVLPCSPGCSTPSTS
jgi:hypothetical protein